MALTKEKILSIDVSVYAKSVGKSVKRLRLLYDFVGINTIIEGSGRRSESPLKSEDDFCKYFPSDAKVVVNFNINPADNYAILTGLALVPIKPKHDYPGNKGDYKK